MTQEYRARTFRSGNSVALRLPKALGVVEGLEMTVRAEDGGFVFRPADGPRRKIKGDWIGTMPWLEPWTPEREGDERELDWNGDKLKHRDD